MRTVAIRLPYWALLLLTVGVPPALAKHRLLIMGPDSKGFSEVLETIQEELITEFDIEHRITTHNTSYEQFALHLEENEPKVLVLLDHAALDLYRHYQRRNADKKPFPPTIVSMAIFVRESISDLENIAGISYEVPPVVSFTNLRDLIDDPVERVGVVYRIQYRPFIERQEDLCKAEQIELVGYQIDAAAKNIDKELRTGLNNLLKKENVDALLILNDTALLSSSSAPRQLRSVWLRSLRRFRKPVVVGVEPLIRQPGIGNFAVLPDHHGIGRQVAEMVLDIMENEWQLENQLVKKPLSVLKYLRIDFARKYFQLKEGKLPEVDKTY